MTKLTVEENEAEILALSEELKNEIEPLLCSMDGTLNLITEKMNEFYAKLENPKETYYSLDIVAPNINGKTFRFGEWDDEPYWVSSSESC